MSLYCAKCLTSRTGDVLGGTCATSGCGGVIVEMPLFSTLVDVLPEPMTCGRRADVYPGGLPVHANAVKGQDRWQKFKSNGNRVCSFCGSLHPDDWFALVKASAEANDEAEYRAVVEIEQSDKNYKVYVQQPGVRNAHEGGLKFYMQHLPRTADGAIDVTAAQQAEFSEALRRSRNRFSLMLYGKRAT